MESGRINRKRQSFTMVANKAVRDKNLSLKAKGLYALIQSYLDMEEIGFVVYKTYLQASCCTDGRDSFNSAWKELENAGYVSTERKRTGKGTYIYEYTVYDSPEPKKAASPPAGNPHTENPLLDNPSAVKPPVGSLLVGEPMMAEPESGSPSVNKDKPYQNLENNTENTRHTYLLDIQTTPEDFLKSKQNGAPLSRSDKAVLTALSKYGFSDEVQIALLDYVLETSQNRLVKSFVEMVAGEWARDGVRTIEDAKRETAKTVSYGKRKEVLPQGYGAPEPDGIDGGWKSPEERERAIAELKAAMEKAAKEG